MRSWVFASVVVAAIACSTTAARPGPVDADSGDSGDDSQPAVTTQPAPAAVEFVDTDDTCASIAGTVTVTKATDETHVASYALYWGLTSSLKLDPTPIRVLPKTGTDLSFILPTTALPFGARFLLAFASDENGVETTNGAATAIAMPIRFPDITAGLHASTQGPSYPPTGATFDALRQKLLVLLSDFLIECDADGSSCALLALPAALGVGRALAIDTQSAKLLILGQNTSTMLARCETDGTSCSVVDISSAQAGADLAIDPTHQQLVVSTLSSTDVALTRCALDGTACVDTPIAAAPYTAPSAIVDEGGNGIAMAGASIEGPMTATFYRSQFDGTDVSTLSVNGANMAALAFDDSTLHLDLLTANSTLGTSLDDCAPDMTACTTTLLSTSFQLAGGHDLALDPTHDALFVAGTDGDIISILRCKLDGSACSSMATDPGVLHGQYGRTYATTLLRDDADRTLLMVLDLNHGEYWPDDVPGLAIACQQ